MIQSYNYSTQATEEKRNEQENRHVRQHTPPRRKLQGHEVTGPTPLEGHAEGIQAQEAPEEDQPARQEGQEAKEHDAPEAGMKCERCQGLLIRDTEEDMQAGTFRHIMHCINCGNNVPLSRWIAISERRCG